MHKMQSPTHPTTPLPGERARMLAALTGARVVEPMMTASEIAAAERELAELRREVTCRIIEGMGK